MTETLAAAQRAGALQPGAPKTADAPKPAESAKPKSADTPKTKTAAATKGQVRLNIAALDKDGDGKISKQEWPGRAQRFDRLDANKDGYLSKDELPKNQ